MEDLTGPRAGRADGELLDALADAWRAADPMPADLTARMLRAAQAETELLDADWDYELMLLVERTDELVGARGSTLAAYTLRFTHGDVELLVRVAATRPGRSRIDGWIVPLLPATVRAVIVGEDDDLACPGEVVGDNGRFELTDVAAGLVRLLIDPQDPARTAILTPVFEI